MTIVDAGRRKSLDLGVAFPPRSEGPQPSGSVILLTDAAPADCNGVVSVTSPASASLLLTA